MDRDDRRNDRLATAGLGAGLASALAASICCIGPIAAAMFGLTSLGALVRFESLRPWFAASTALFLAVAFVLSYRRRPSADCVPGSVCDIHGQERVRHVNRIVLWIVAIIIIVVLTFPTWSNWVLG